MKEDILNNDYYKSLYSNTSIEIENNGIIYEIMFFADALKICVRKNESILNQFTLNPILFYKECEEVLKLLEQTHSFLESKTIKISNDMDFYYSKIELIKKENNYIFKRSDDSLTDNKNSIESNVLIFEDIEFAKKFYSILKRELESLDFEW